MEAGLTLDRFRACAAARLGAVAAVSTLLAACSPALDWREVRSGNGRYLILFPCKPTQQERALPMGSQSAQATLQACDAQGLTFAVLSLVPPAAAEPQAPLMDGLRRSAELRWGPADGGAEPPADVKPQPGGAAFWQRHRREGSNAAPTLTQALFVQGDGVVLQVSVSGASLPAAALESFFGSLRPAP